MQCVATWMNFRVTAELPNLVVDGTIQMILENEKMASELSCWWVQHTASPLVLSGNMKDGLSDMQLCTILLGILGVDTDHASWVEHKYRSRCWANTCCNRRSPQYLTMGSCMRKDITASTQQLCMLLWCSGGRHHMDLYFTVLRCIHQLWTKTGLGSAERFLNTIGWDNPMPPLLL